MSETVYTSIAQKSFTYGKRNGMRLWRQFDNDDQFGEYGLYEGRVWWQCFLMINKTIVSMFEWSFHSIPFLLPSIPSIHFFRSFLLRFHSIYIPVIDRWPLPHWTGGQRPRGDAVAWKATCVLGDFTWECGCADCINSVRWMRWLPEVLLLLCRSWSGKLGTKVKLDKYLNGTGKIGIKSSMPCCV